MTLEVGPVGRRTTCLPATMWWLWRIHHSKFGEFSGVLPGSLFYGEGGDEQFWWCHWWEASAANFGRIELGGGQGASCLLPACHLAAFPN